MRVLHKCLFLFFGTAFLGPACIAQNMLANPGFDTDPGGWTTDNGPQITVGWSNIDAAGQAGSGSVTVTNISAGMSNGVGIRQCLPAVAGDSYRFGGQTMVPSGGTQSLSDLARIGLRFFTDVACTSSVSTTFTGTPASFDTWVSYGPQTSVAPAGTNGMQLMLVVTKFPAGGSATAHFDNLFVIPDDIFGSGFE